MTRLAETTRARRHALCLTQADLADLAGVSERSVRALESDKPTVRLDIVVRVLDALGLELLPVLRGTHG